MLLMNITHLGYRQISEAPENMRLTKSQLLQMGKLHLGRKGLNISGSDFIFQQVSFKV